MSVPFAARLAELGAETDPHRRQAIAVQMQRLLDDASAVLFASAAINYSLSTSSVRAVFDGNGNPQLHYFYRV